MNKKEQTKLRVQRYRKRKDSVTQDNDVTQPDVTQEMAPASYVEGVDGKMYEALPERPRYLKLSDGQVLDRLNQPVVGEHYGQKPSYDVQPECKAAMRRCNEAAYNYVPTKQRKR